MKKSCDGSGWIDVNIRDNKRCPGCLSCLPRRKKDREDLRLRKEGWTLRELGDAWRSGVQAAVEKLRDFKQCTPPGHWWVVEMAAKDLESKMLPKDMHRTDVAVVDRVVKKVAKTRKGRSK